MSDSGSFCHGREMTGLLKPGAALLLAAALFPAMLGAGCGDAEVIPWEPRLVVSGISPAWGPESGGAQATILGLKFQSGAQVTIGGSAAGSVVVVDPGTITCLLPSGLPGAADVTVTNPDGSSDTRTGIFTFLAGGSPSPGFGLDGALVADFGAGVDAAWAVAADASFLYVAGQDASPGNEQWRIEKRRISDGLPDSAFGTAGTVVINPSSADEETAWAVKLDTSFLYVAGWDRSVGNVQWRIEKLNLSDGSAATGFGTGGTVTSNPSSGSDYAYAMAIDAAFLYVAGTDWSPGNNQWRIEKRLLSNGSLDPGFGSGGSVTSNPSGGDDAPMAIAVDSEFMYVAGRDLQPVNHRFRIEKRRLSDGSLVSGFGSGGVVTSNPTVNNDYANAISIDSEFMYVLGRDVTGTNWQWRYEKRMLSDGSLAAGFGTGGVVSTSGATDDRPYAMAIDSVFLYAAGCDSGPGDYRWRIEKRNLSDGSLAAGFGDDGVLCSDPSAGDDRIYGIVLQSGRIHAAGYDSVPGDLRWRIESRFASDGSTGAAMSSPAGSGPDSARALAADSDSIYVAGHDASPGNSQWRVEKRRIADGGFVTVFGSGGAVVSNPGSGSDSIAAIAADSSCLYLAGYDSVPGDRRWRIEKRSASDGSLVQAFGTAGVITSDFSLGDEEAAAIAADASWIYAAGVDMSAGGGQWRIEKRSASDGAFAPGFGAGGAVLSNPSVGLDMPCAIAKDAAYFYVAGWDSSPGNRQWRIEKRSIADGAIVPGFGTGGAVTSNPGSQDDAAMAIAIDSSYVYIAGFDTSPGDSQMRILKLAIADGSPAPGFGASGAIVSNPGPSADMLFSVAVDSSFIYAAGTSSDPGSGRWRIEKRRISDGILVPEFGEAGAAGFDLGSGDDRANAILLHTLHVICAGDDTSSLTARWRIEKRLK